MGPVLSDLASAAVNTYRPLVHALGLIYPRYDGAATQTRGRSQLNKLRIADSNPGQLRRTHTTIAVAMTHHAPDAEGDVCTELQQARPHPGRPVGAMRSAEPAPVPDTQAAEVTSQAGRRSGLHDCPQHKCYNDQQQHHDELDHRHQPVRARRKQPTHPAERVPSLHLSPIKRR
jgi:hypothetical protein